MKKNRNIIKYKNYTGSIEFDDENNFFHGEVINMRDVITFQGKSIAELRKALKDSIEDYLDFCKKRKEDPEKPFSGHFIVRTTPEIHQKIFHAAKKSGKSLNAWIEEKLAKSA